MSKSKSNALWMVAFLTGLFVLDLWTMYGMGLKDGRKSVVAAQSESVPDSAVSDGASVDLPSDAQDDDCGCDDDAPPSTSTAIEDGKE
jgi:hypothetical protein